MGAVTIDEKYAKMHAEGRSAAEVAREVWADHPEYEVYQKVYVLRHLFRMSLREAKDIVAFLPASPAE